MESGRSPVHYFSQGDDGDGGSKGEEAQPSKEELKWQKKLRDVEALEKRRDAGEKLDALQQRKLETKPSILEELATLQGQGWVRLGWRLALVCFSQGRTFVIAPRRGSHSQGVECADPRCAKSTSAGP